jgi:nucleoporin NUP2
VKGGTPASEGGEAPALFSAAQHNVEGEGEEDEETTHAIKAKVFKMSKKKEDGADKSYWADLGVGMLRLKKHKESESRRMLLRNSSTGKIVIVSRCTACFVSSLTAFCRTSTCMTVLNIRVKTVDQASELKTAIDREVKLVKKAT